MANWAKILQPTEDSIRQVGDILLRGDVVALPTETVYGLAGIIGDEGAIRKIFEIKGRPFVDPLIIHVLNLSSLLNLVDITDELFKKIKLVADAFCPGPLTFVVKKRKIVSDLITAGKKTVAIRIPSHPVFRAVLRRSGPLAAPSANPFGYISPTCSEHVMTSMGDKISYILDGGTCAIGMESTVLDLSGECVTILRPGAVTAEMVEDVLGEKIEPYRFLVAADPSAPGMLKQHYSPHTRLRLFKKLPEEILSCFSENASSKIAIVYLSHREVNVEAGMVKKEKSIFWLSEDGDLDEVARNMFGLLQQLDGMNFDMICCQTSEKIGIGTAINDRLSRAAAKL